MTEYIVHWTENGQNEHRIVEADTPEEAAEKVVQEQDWNSEAFGVEVGVAESVLRRHDVILDE